MNWFKWLQRPRLPDRRADFLDRVVFQSARFDWRVRDLVQGVLITGATGSGKTSGPLEAVVAALWKMGAGSIHFCAKRGECKRWQTIAAEYGRTAVVIDHTARHRMNFVEAVDNPLADLPTRAGIIASGIGTLLEASARGNHGGENDQFWRESSARALRTVVFTLLLGKLPVTPAHIVAFLQHLPASPEALDSDFFRTGFCFQALKAAFAHKAEYEEEYRAASAWALTEMATLSQKTKSVIVATLTGTLDAASRGVVRKIIATDSNFSLAEAIRNDRIVLIDFDYATWMDTAKFLYSAIKHMAQLECLRREVTPASKPWPLVIDEYQQVVCEHDFLYASLSRSSRCPMIACTQGHESLHATFPGENGRSKVFTLIGNLVSKFYCLPTPQTAEELYQSLGRRKRYMSNASTQAGGYQSPLDLYLPQPSRATGGVSETYESVLFPSELARMRTGGKSNRYVVDALLVQSGRTFDTGYSYVPVAFTQRT